MIKHIKGDLLKSDCDYICHQVNCQGIMGSGIAKQIRDRYPEVYISYRSMCALYDPDEILGFIDIVNLDARYNVINIFGQLNYGYDGKQYTSYDAFTNALKMIKEWVPAGMSIGFPKNIGCGLGGADWDCISALIEAILGTEYDVYIYEYEPEEKQ